MSLAGLEEDVKQALRTAVEQVLSGQAALGSAWSGLAQELKARSYEEIADMLLGSHHPTVSAAVLKALQDDRLSPDEMRGILAEWARGRVGENTLLAGLIDDLAADGTLTPKEAFARL